MTGSSIEALLDLARWAPSGDNSQPWRFIVQGDRAVEIRSPFFVTSPRLGGQSMIM